MNDNLENKIKKEFQQRKIKPSHNAWEILNAQLEVKSTKSKYKKLGFLVYAAIFVGLLFGLITLFTTNNTINQPIIVDENNNENNTEILNNSNKELQNNLTESTKKLKLKKEELVKNTVVIKHKTATIYAKKKNKKTTKYKNSVKSLVNETVNSNQTNRNDVAINLISKTIKKQFKVLDSNKLKTSMVKINSEKKAIEPHKNKQEEPKKRRKLILSSADDIDRLLASAIRSTPKVEIEKIQLHSDALKFVAESNIKKPLSKKIYRTLTAGVHTVEDFMDRNN